MARVLVIAPHMDDEVLGCGGTIAKHVDAGDHVEVAILCHRAYDHRFDAKANEIERANAEAARRTLGYARVRFLDLPDERLYANLQETLGPLETAVREARPDVAYVPHPGDLNQDHRTAAHASNIALRAIGAPGVRRVLAFEVPSATEQTFAATAPAFAPNVFVDISAQLERKIDAMRAYERESRAFPHPRSAEALRALAAVRGAQSLRPAAEAFMLMRETV